MYFPDFLDYQETNANRCYKSTWKKSTAIVQKKCGNQQVLS